MCRNKICTPTVLIQFLHLVTHQDMGLRDTHDLSKKIRFISKRHGLLCWITTRNYVRSVLFISPSCLGNPRQVNKNRIQNYLVRALQRWKTLEPKGILPVWLPLLVPSRRHFGWRSHPLRNKNSYSESFPKYSFGILLRKVGISKVGQIWLVGLARFGVRHGSNPSSSTY